MDPKEIKTKLYAQCESVLFERMNQIKTRMASIQEAKSTETKSSAGDKFETGRAMMQLEEDKCNTQLAVIMQSLAALKKVQLDINSETVQLGSLVFTNRGNYFISIGAGKLLLANTSYYCISLDAPIGRLLHGKTSGQEVNFNNNPIVIQAIS